MLFLGPIWAKKGARMGYAQNENQYFYYEMI